MYIAVVIKNGALSDRPRGDWASFVGDTKATVISQAVKARKAWEQQYTGAVTYRILVGKLTEEVKEPTTYKLVGI